jgi:hypothetical protein
MSIACNIYQSIEILSKEKGIDPQIIRDAVKDAMLSRPSTSMPTKSWWRKWRTARARSRFSA